MGNKPSHAVETSFTTTSDDEFIIVTPTDRTQYVLVESNAPPIVQAHQFQNANRDVQLSYSLTSVGEQFFRFSFLVPMALYSNIQSTVNLESRRLNYNPAFSLLSSAISEFPGLNKKAPLALIKQELEILRTFLHIDSHKLEYFNVSISPQIKRHKITKKSELLKLFKSYPGMNAFTLFLLQRAWSDMALQGIIKELFKYNKFKKDLKIYNAIKENNLIFIDELKDLLVDKPGGISSKRWTKFIADKKTYENINTKLWTQFNILQQKMKTYAMQNFAAMSPSDRQIYAEGMERIVARIDRESDITMFYADFPRLLALKKIDYLLEPRYMWSLIANAYVQAAQLIFTIKMRDSSLSREYNHPALALTLVPLALTFARVASDFVDSRASLREFLAMRYRENLSLYAFNSYLPYTKQLHQPQNLPIQVAEHDAGRFRKVLGNLDFLTDGRFKFSLFVLMIGALMRNAIEEIANNFEDTNARLALYVTMYFVVELSLTAPAIAYARDLDNALVPSNVRVQQYDRLKDKSSQIIDVVSEKACSIVKFAQNSSRFWHKPKPVVVKTKATVELIEDDSIKLGHRKLS